MRSLKLEYTIYNHLVQSRSFVGSESIRVSHTPFSPGTVESSPIPPLQKPSPSCEVLSEGATSPTGIIESQPFSPSTYYFDQHQLYYRGGYYGDSPAVDTPVGLIHIHL